MISAAWRKEFPKTAKCIFFVPVRIFCSHYIPSGRINVQCGVDIVVQFQEFIHDSVPLIAVWGHQRPLTCNLSEAQLLVVIVHIYRPGLHIMCVVQRLKESVEVSHAS